MLVLIGIALIISIIALIATLNVTKNLDTEYNKSRSFSNLSIIYIFVLPVVIVLVAVLAFVL
ncbi:BshB3 potential contributor to bacillithiol synthesis [Bacillus sp. FJAT-45350]|uniref:BshB3 potential contributor to bacillithiol synthesis n=1 Tax=Bacillus sp. FJAT-45350 TaxID=2011014 RepID=UPI000BB6ACCB|nr:BshB3 potential contributor to bacillithiol synthesis [Bacillus sp. FJAT-45350]